jgi:hypothetical protein
MSLTYKLKRDTIEPLSNKERWDEMGKTKEDKSPRDFSKVTGVSMLLVIASIAFSSYIVIMGVEQLIPKLMLVPQILFAAVEAVRRFTK